MRVKILGTERTGKKSFYLIADHNECFKIEALKYISNETTNFENITEIDWRFSGQSVELTFYDGTKQYFDFLYTFDKVIISKAGLNIVNADKTFKFSSEETSDLRRGLIIAMQNLDATGNPADLILSDRLQKLEEKLK